MAIPSLLRSASWCFARDRSVPASDSHRSNRADIGFEPSGDTPLDTTQEHPGRRQVLLAGEKEGHIDRHSGKIRIFHSRQAFLWRRVSG